MCQYGIGRPAASENFQEADFVALWLKEIAEIPPTRSSDFHLVTGLLLPVWKHLPRTAGKVYRLQTDRACPGTGRARYPGASACFTPPLLHTSDVPDLRAAFHLDGAIALSPNDVFSALIDDGRPVSLRGGLGLRISTVMGAKRIELTGYSDTEVDQLKSFGFFSEIIAWRLRLFLPLKRLPASRRYRAAPPQSAANILRQKLN